MDVIKPNWPAPTWVQAVSTTIHGGASQAPFASLNLALHVNDNAQDVLRNRLQLKQHFNWQHDPLWLFQTHSNRVINEQRQSLDSLGFDADGVWTQQWGVPCVVLTGDCLPLLLTDTKGSVVAAVHCGWRGILNGIIEKAVKIIVQQSDGEILAWLGPGIGADCYEVGEDFRIPFIQSHPLAHLAFKPIGQQKYLADMPQLATLRLRESGVNAIYGGEHCTYKESERFYSYRRDKITGRMASLIWLAAS